MSTVLLLVPFLIVSVTQTQSTSTGPVVMEPIKRSDFDDPNSYQDQPSFPQTSRSFTSSSNKRGSLRIGSSPSTHTRWPTYDPWPSSQTTNNELPLKPNNLMSSQASTPIADSIKCSGGQSSTTQSSTTQSFTANITPPPGFANVPVFEDAPSINPSVSDECSMKLISGGNFLMKITNFIKCGVTTQKGNDGKVSSETSVLESQDSDLEIRLSRLEAQTMKPEICFL